MQHEAAALLTALRNADGGMPPTRGGASEPEPTALAALALDDERAHEWLEASQEADGSFLIGPRSIRNDSPTALAAIALRPGRARAEAVRYLTDHQAQPLEYDGRFPHDADTRGWGWTSKTFGWVEPTARALLAMRLLAGESSAITDGQRVLEDRECVGGGWNYGNRNVLGKDLEPYLQTTAAAVMALHDERGPLRDRGIRVIRNLWNSERGGLGWSMSVTALRLCGEEADDMADELADHVARTGLYHDAVALGWAAIALGDGVTKLRIAT